MSAFFIGNDQLGRLATELVNYPPFKDKEVRDLAEKLFYLNREALKQRYQDPGVPEFEFIPGEFSDYFQFVESLKCFLYQCSEGSVPEQKLFKELDMIRNILIVYFTPEILEGQQVEWK